MKLIYEKSQPGRRASDLPRYVTGVTLPVDGGQLRCARAWLISSRPTSGITGTTSERRYT